MAKKEKSLFSQLTRLFRSGPVVKKSILKMLLRKISCKGMNCINYCKNYLFLLRFFLLIKLFFEEMDKLT